MDNLLIILSICTLLSFLSLLLVALTNFRDDLVNSGWINEEHWLGQRSIKSQNKQVYRILKALKFSETLLPEIARTTRHIKDNNNKDSDNLSYNLLMQLKPLIRNLEDSYTYTKNYYIDSIGETIYELSSTNQNLAYFINKWYNLLEKNGKIQPVDFIIANKGGNFFLANQLKSELSKHDPHIGFFIAKILNDNSRVKGDNNYDPHRTDFEGLDAFLQKNTESNRSEETKLNGIFVDDNCTSGYTMCNAIDRFNIIIERFNLPINPIKDAIVLYTIKSSKLEKQCNEKGVVLHSIVSMGYDDMHFLLHTKRSKVEKDTERFKSSYGCESSKLLKV